MAASRATLVEKAAAAVARGKYKRAYEAYVELQALEPSDGAWPRRRGEMLRHLGRAGEAVQAFARSVETYASAGFTVKAIAVCKLILRIEPGHTEAKEILESLNKERMSRPRRRGETPGVGRKTDPPKLDLGRPLEDIRLRDTVEGARSDDGDKRVTLIPIDESDFAGFTVGADPIEARLRQTALFDELAAADLAVLLEGVILREVAAGEVVFRQGDRGKELYVIDEGEVHIVFEPRDGEPVELGRLGEGEFFGEVALVAETPRSATVIASSATQLLVLSRTAISQLVQSEPRVLTHLLRFLRDRLFDRLTSTHELLTAFSVAERAELAARFELLEVEQGAELITFDKPSKALYVILAGTMIATRDDRVLATLGPGDVTGEMSLLTQQPAIATVAAETKVLVVRLGGTEFRDLIMTHPQVLAYIGELADSRRELLEQFDRGEGAYGVSRLPLV